MPYLSPPYYRWLWHLEVALFELWTPVWRRTVPLPLNEGAVWDAGPPSRWNSGIRNGTEKCDPCSCGTFVWHPRHGRTGVIRFARPASRSNRVHLWHQVKSSCGDSFHAIPLRMVHMMSRNLVEKLRTISLCFVEMSTTQTHSSRSK